MYRQVSVDREIAGVLGSLTVRFFGQTRQRERLATETDLSIDRPNRFEHDLSLMQGASAIRKSASLAIAYGLALQESSPSGRYLQAEGVITGCNYKRIQGQW
jgi:hypothetical protein